MLKWICLSWMVFAMVAGAQPAITTNGIVNAASSVPVGLPNSSIAQGSMFSIYGTAMGPASSPPLLSFPLQKTLGGVTVQIQDASGATRQAIPLYVGPTQINAILPSATAVGTATATVTYGGSTSAPASFAVVKSSFGTLALNQGGSGPGIVLNYVQNASWPVNTIISSAQPGQSVVLWGTGLGPVTGDETVAPVQTDLRSGLDPMYLWVGGQKVNIDYAGRSTAAGQDQINFKAPNIPGCWVPVMLQIGDVVSNTVTISIAPSGGMCQDPTVPTLNPVVVEANGLKEGSLLLEQYTLHQPPPTGDSKPTLVASAEFGMYAWPSPLFPSSQAGMGIDTYGACTVNALAMAPSSLLDAGSPMTLTGPDGATTTLTQPRLYPQGFYDAVPNALPAGVYTLKNGSGGKDVGSFTASLTLPAPFTWTNPDPLTVIDRTLPQKFTWTGGSGDVFIVGSSSAIVNRAYVGATFTCLAKASDGSFTVPTYVLAALPASYTNAAGLELYNYGATTTFSATGLDFGLFQALFATQEQNVNVY
jgi:uncharacterized protein (TIGR03437 family)